MIAKALYNKLYIMCYVSKILASTQRWNCAQVAECAQMVLCWTY